MQIDTSVLDGTTSSKPTLTKELALRIYELFNQFTDLELEIIINDFLWKGQSEKWNSFFDGLTAVQKAQIKRAFNTVHGKVNRPLRDYLNKGLDPLHHTHSIFGGILGRGEKTWVFLYVCFNGLDLEE